MRVVRIREHGGLDKLIVRGGARAGRPGRARCASRCARRASTTSTPGCAAASPATPSRCRSCRVATARASSTPSVRASCRARSATASSLAPGPLVRRVPVVRRRPRPSLPRLRHLRRDARRYLRLARRRAGAQRALAASGRPVRDRRRVPARLPDGVAHARGARRIARGRDDSRPRGGRGRVDRRDPDREAARRRADHRDDLDPREGGAREGDRRRRRHRLREGGLRRSACAT